MNKLLSEEGKSWDSRSSIKWRKPNEKTKKSEKCIRCRGIEPRARAIIRLKTAIEANGKL